MTVSTSSMPLLVPESKPRTAVDTAAPQSTGSDPDGEARRLIAAMAAGDETAFRQLYDRFQPRLFRLVLVLSRGDNASAHDAVQAAFVTAARKLKRIESEAHLWNWLARVARQHLAKQRRQQHHDLSTVALASVPDQRCPDRELDSELERQLDAALEAIEPEERALIESFYFERLSHSQIAVQLSTTPKAVSSRLERARAKLRSLINSRVSRET